jgi:hypothetical protein
VLVELPGEFAPDFTFAETGPNFTERDASAVSDAPRADPYRSIVVETLLSAQRNNGVLGPVDVAQLGRSIDGYAVEYLGKQGRPYFHFFRPLVKASVFIEVRDRFINRFRQAVASGASLASVNDLVSFGIVTQEDAFTFTRAVLDLLLVKRYRTGDIWKSTFVPGSKYSEVRREPDLQRDIHANIAPWFEIHGAKCMREVAGSGGSLDMLVVVPRGNKQLQVAIELKYAHHAEIENAIENQLRAYMDDLDAKNGIYLVYWCKGGVFQLPSEYENAAELKKKLTAARKADDVAIIVVDSSPREPPSRR